jgi:hypothetical protein
MQICLTSLLLPLFYQSLKVTQCYFVGSIKSAVSPIVYGPMALFVYDISNSLGIEYNFWYDDIPLTCPRGLKPDFKLGKKLMH